MFFPTLVRVLLPFSDCPCRTLVVPPARDHYSVGEGVLCPIFNPTIKLPDLPRMLKNRKLAIQNGIHLKRNILLFHPNQTGQGQSGAPWRSHQRSQYESQILFSPGSVLCVGTADRLSEQRVGSGHTEPIKLQLWQYGAEHGHCLANLHADE